MAGALVANLRAVDGGTNATALASAAPIAGLAVTVGAIVIVAAVGTLSGWLVGGGRALFAMGLVLLWPAVRSGAVEEMLRSDRSPGLMRSFAIESVILGGLLALAAIATDRIGASIKRKRMRANGDSLPDVAPARKHAIDTALATTASAVAMVFVSWLVAIEGLKGQTTAAGVIAGVAGGLMARLAGGEASRWTIVLAATAAAVFAPLWAIHLHGADILQASYAGVLFPPARLAPLDWLAGSLVGGSLGWSWASSSLQREVDADAQNFRRAPA